MKDPLSGDMRRDPFDVPRGVDTEHVPLLGKALGLLGFKEEDRPLVATPSNRENHVIGAKEGGPCCKCGQKVWLAPSTQRSKDAFTAIVCLECCEKAVGITTCSVALGPNSSRRIREMLKKLGYL